MRINIHTPTDECIQVHTFTDRNTQSDGSEVSAQWCAEIKMMSWYIYICHVRAPPLLFQFTARLFVDSCYILAPLVVWVSHPRLMSLEVWVELKIERWDVTRSSEEMPGRLRASIYEWSGGNYILVSIYHGFHSTSWWCYQTLVPNFTPNIAPKPKSYLFVTLAITCRVLTNQKSRLHPNLLCCRQLPHVVCSLKSITSSGGEEARHLGACVCVCARCD